MGAGRVKWWGWGREDKLESLESRPALVDFLRQRLHIATLTRREVVHFEDIAIAPPMLSGDELVLIADIVGEGNLTTDPRDRVAHAAGKSYVDLVRIRSGSPGQLPDAVAYPKDEASVRRLLEFARRRGFAVIPFGGGTSVVGGVTPPSDSRATITLDLRRMDRVLEIDEHSGLVTAEAGILGPDLEHALNAKGLTLGHFPQSWEFSSLGGWIATRAAGGLSNRYGRIDDLVVGVRLLAPTLTLDLRPLPGESHGPDLRELVLGSEGTLGVITQATLRAHPAPVARRFASRLFRSFVDGVAALRTLAKDRALPDMAYLSDEEETRFLAASAGLSPEGAGIVARRLANASLLTMAFEGSKAHTAHGLRTMEKATANTSTNVGARPAKRWYTERFEFPYLRDSFLDHGILVDTVETAASWSSLLHLYEAGRKALHDALARGGAPGVVLCHVSHAYLDGASLYYTFLASQREGHEIEQWETMKATVTEAFLSAGGALSHHHGIGTDHAPYLRRIIGEDGLVVLRALKRELDPEGIMNPGKLMDGTT